MLKTKKQKLSVVVFLVLVCCFLIYLYTKPEVKKNDIPQNPKEIGKIQKSFLEINGIKYEEEILGETFYSKWNFIYKIYKDA